MCLLILLSGTAKAEIISEVDDFDKTKYIYSYVRLPGIKGKDIEVKNLLFRKCITANNVEYMLIFHNANYYGVFPSYNDFLIKFDDEIYTLPRKGNTTVMYNSTAFIPNFTPALIGGYFFVVSSSYGYHEMVLSVPENIVEKILSKNKITLRMPLYPRKYSKSSIRNFTVDINEDILSEWRQVIQTE